MDRFVEIMERFSKKSFCITGLLCLLFLPLGGCRCAGFYCPVYSRSSVETLLQKNQTELTSFAEDWLQNHRNDEMTYENCHGEKLTVARLTPNIGFAPLQLSPQEVQGLQQFANRFKIEHVYVLKTSNDTTSWYVLLSFQGGSKWPYGLIYIPEGEPLNLLNDANGGPGPGFSKITAESGRWFYFESK
jgi:hypothetical protein